MLRQGGGLVELANTDEYEIGLVLSDTYMKRTTIR